MKKEFENYKFTEIHDTCSSNDEDLLFDINQMPLSIGYYYSWQQREIFFTFSRKAYKYQS